ARHLLAVDETGRLCFLDGIAARPQVGKVVRAIGARDHGEGDADPQITGAGESYHHVGNGCLADFLDRVVVQIDVDVTTDAGRHEFTEIVVHAVDTSLQHDTAEDIVAGGAALAAYGVSAVHVSDRLGLDNEVVARPQ